MYTLLVLFLSACSTPGTETDKAEDTGDTSVVSDDCEGGEGTWYPDADGDGFGEAAAGVVACLAPAGTIADATDCDDADAQVNPDAAEVCDRVDNDCDAQIDEADADLTGTTLWYADVDADGHGDPASSMAACAAPAGYLADADDCDDTDAAVNPDAIEVCDTIDNDCDVLIDEADADLADATLWYADVDGDGHGDASSSIAACDAPAGYLADADDCDDTDGGVSPSAIEVCDRDDVDEDCDDLADDADDRVEGQATWYADTDGDGYGDAGAPTTACDAPRGHVVDATDCLDRDSTVNPGAAEVCDDGVDNNCDRAIDEGCDIDPEDPPEDLALCGGENTGDTFEDGYSTGGPDLLIGAEFTPTEDLSIGRVEVFTGEGAGTNTVSIWTDSDGFAETELGAGSWSMDRANSWQGADLDSCVSVTAGTTYWAVWAPVNGTQSSLDSSGTRVSYSGSFDAGRSWSGPYSGYVKYRLYCCADSE
jgi:hypothetical protein